MNLLAHAYLSFNEPQLLVGNMISDYVKGKAKFNYPPGIQNGIALHRAIDAFTDAHEATREAKSFFKPAYRLYAGACVDVMYDHFLANDQQEFPTTTSLNALAQSTYTILEKNKEYLPEKFAAMLPAMQNQNWLFHYGSLWGIQKSYGGLIRRSAHLTDSHTAFQILQDNYNALQKCYQNFFPPVKNLARQWEDNPAAIK